MTNINIPTDGTSRINVFENDELLYHVERKKYLFTGKNDFFINNEKVATIKTYIISLKIKFQRFDKKISNCIFIPFVSFCQIDKDKIIIIDNPLFIIFPWYYSLIFFNNKLVAKVKIKSLLDIEGVNLVMNFKTDDKEIKFYSTMTYLMTCLHTNI